MGFKDLKLGDKVVFRSKPDGYLNAHIRWRVAVGTTGKIVELAKSSFKVLWDGRERPDNYSRERLQEKLVEPLVLDDWADELLVRL